MVNPPEKVCPACGEEIIRQEGQKGRLPKYHPECKPQRTSRNSSDGPRPVRVSAKERLAAEQVEEALETARRGLLKAVGFLMLIDPFDAFVLHINSPDIVSNLRPILMRFPWLREQASNATTGASIFGLIIAVGTTVLPIMAHHKLIPGKMVTNFLTQLPMVMLNIQRSMTENEGMDMTAVLIQRVREQKQREEQARRFHQSAEPVDASNR